ncbi:MAG TPA: calcium-translocating P-type ATPase, PMCA-type [Dictyoglomaceae bacterium]|nr:calcium-translocating P-type ATPase, PMCA-type [Dictyoglomaceae bacterium]
MWHEFSKEEVLSELQVDPEVGLTQEEVVARRQKYGKNVLPEKPPEGFLRIFIRQFKEFLTIILLVATLISFILGETKDAIAILIIVLINALLGSFQEYKAEKTLSSLKSLVSSTVKVLRDKEVVEIPMEDLVPGDIIFVEEGEKIPADVRWIKTTNLQVDESILTGESEAVRKDADFIAKKDISLGDQLNMGFKGTTVLSGRGEGVVVGTGINTALGNIARMLSEIKEEPTPLQRELAKLGKQLSIIILILVFVLLGIGILQGRDFFEMFFTSVSLAVAAIPEGLPTVITILLALGVQEMARRKAVVRKLSAVEALGATSVICTDKTGTLTENKMDLVKIGLPNGRICEKDDFEELKEELKDIFLISFLASNVRKKQDGTFVGDPLEVAICRNYENLYSVPFYFWKIDEIPFDSIRKRVSVLYKNKNDGRYILATKGAGEEIIKRSKFYQIGGEIHELSEERRRELLEDQNNLAKEGLRVLGVAQRTLENLPSKDLWEVDFTFLGFIAFLDPLREGVKEAIEECKKAGIRPIIVTGDYLLTAKKIAKDLGIDVDNGDLYGGEELQSIGFGNISWDNVVVFSRVLPEHKMEIVRKLKERGEIVAMTGDGVNDAPALKMADIGVSMGQRGTDVAREASDLVLLDDSFATIVKAVEEGRRIFNNIRKVTYYLLSCNFSEILVVSISIFLGFPLPLTPLELLWINLVTDSFPALALGSEPPEKDIMNRKPRRVNGGILNKDLWKRIVRDGILIGMTSFILFLIGLRENDLTLGRTMVFSGLVFAQIFQALRLSLMRMENILKEAFSNKYLSLAVIFSIAVQLLVLFTPFGVSFFNLKVLSFNEFLLVLLISLIPIYEFIGERIYEKIFKRTSNL